MNLDSSSNSGVLSLAAMRRIDEVCVEFERQWKKGTPPDILNFVSGSGKERERLIQEIVILDVAYRNRLSESATTEDYLRRLPEDRTSIEAAFAALEKSESLENAAIAETTDGRDQREQSDGRMMRVKCPHCNNRILLLEKTAGQITCDSCGSSISIFRPPSSSVGPQTPELVGRYQVLKLLGRGAFGSVYKAYDPQLDVDVAIKIPRAGYFSSDEEEERFFREARSAAQLKHPNIVSVYDFGIHKGLPYIVSLYIQGSALSDRLAVALPNFRDTVELLRKTAEAVHFAHSKGVIHRDLKPENILIDEAGNPFVADFGMAKREDGEITMTLDGQILGTPAYMAPEQARGDHAAVDQRSDVYSLGIVLFEMLTGELPFRGNRRMLIQQVLFDDPPALNKLNSSVPRELAAICHKAIAKEPNLRYRNAQELARDLENWLQGRPVNARPRSVWERAIKWRRRNALVANLWLASISLAVSVAIASSVGFYLTSIALDRESAALFDKSRAVESFEFELYVNQLNFALREFEAGNVNNSRQLVADCPPHLRNWEWNYLFRVCNPEQVVFQAHRFSPVAISPDGNLVAFEDKRNVIVKRLEDGKTLKSFEGVNGPLSFSPQRNLLAARSNDSIVLLDLDSGQKSLPLEPGTSGVRFAYKVELLNSGTQIAIGNSDSADVRIFRVSDGDLVKKIDLGETAKNCLGEIDGEATIHVRWNETDSKSKYLALRVWVNRDSRPATRSWILVWDLLQDKVSHQFGPIDGAIRDLAFDAQSTRLIGGFTSDEPGRPDIHIWDLETGQTLTSLVCDQRSWGEHRIVFLGPQYGVDTVVFHPTESDVFVAGTEGCVSIWDIKRLSHIRKFRGHSDRIGTIAVDRRGKRLVSAGRDGTVRVWHLKKWPRRHFFDHSSEIFHSDFTVKSNQNGELIVACAEMVGLAKGSAKAIVWNTIDGELKPITGDFDVTTFDIHPHRPWIAAASPNTTIRIWNLEKPDQDRELIGHTAAVDFICFSEDGKWMGSLGSDASLIIWNTVTWEKTLEIEKAMPFHGKQFYLSRPVAFSSDSSRVAFGNSRLGFDIWELSSHRRNLSIDRSSVNRGEKDYIRCVAFHPEGRLLASASNRGLVEIWSKDSPIHPIQSMDCEQRMMQKIEFSSDGKYLIAVEGSWLCVWNTETWQTQYTVEENIVSASIDSNSARLFTSGLRGLSIRELSSGKELMALHDALFSASVLKNGKVISASLDGSVSIMDGSPIKD